MIISPTAHAVRSVVRGLNTPLSQRRVFKTRDSLQTYDRQTIDSTGVFLIGQLEKLDPKLHQPLVSYTWSRDMPLREDVTMADEVSSFTNSTFAAPGGIAGSNKAWAGKDSNALVGVALDIGKTSQNLPIWAMNISWTIPELASAAKLGKPLDAEKFNAMQTKYNMDLDEEAYVGDSALGMNGLLNHSAIYNVAANGSGVLWINATPAQILSDFNLLLNSVWKNTGYTIMPDTVLIDPTDYTLLKSTIVSTAGNISILKFLLDNNAANGLVAGGLKILPCKWLLGTNNGNAKGVAATNSMFAYVRDKDRVRMPLVPLQRTPIEYRSIYQITTYFGRIGGVELVYPDCVGLRSGIG